MACFLRSVIPYMVLLSIVSGCSKLEGTLRSQCELGREVRTHFAHTHTHFLFEYSFGGWYFSHSNDIKTENLKAKCKIDRNRKSAPKWSNTLLSDQIKKQGVKLENCYLVCEELSGSTLSRAACFQGCFTSENKVSFSV